MAKAKAMNRTAGTARRKMSQAEQIRYGMKTGKPLTGSASGVKSITLKEAGEALTQGIVKVRGGKLQMDPVALAMALPVGKLGKVARLLTPKNVRIAGAAKNVVRGAKSRVRVATGQIENANWMEEQGVLGQNAARAYGSPTLRFQGQKYVERGRGAFDENLGSDLVGTGTTGIGAAEAERLVRSGAARKIVGPNGITYVSEGLRGLKELGETQVSTARSIRSQATGVLRRSGDRVEGGTREAAAEIRRRLAALKSRKGGK
jgi:ribosomal protein L30E